MVVFLIIKEITIIYKVYFQYMYVTNIKIAKLVQHYNGEYSITDVDYNNDLVMSYLEQLKSVVTEITD